MIAHDPAFAYSHISEKQTACPGGNIISCEAGRSHLPSLSNAWRSHPRTISLLNYVPCSKNQANTTHHFPPAPSRLWLDDWGGVHTHTNPPPPPPRLEFASVRGEQTWQSFMTKCWFLVLYRDLDKDGRLRTGKRERSS